MTANNYLNYYEESAITDGMARKKLKLRERSYQNQRIVNFREGSGWEAVWKKFADEAILRSPSASQEDRVWIGDLILEAMEEMCAKWNEEKPVKKKA